MNRNVSILVSILTFFYISILISILTSIFIFLLISIYGFLSKKSPLFPFAHLVPKRVARRYGMARKGKGLVGGIVSFSISLYISIYELTVSILTSILISI